MKITNLDNIDFIHSISLIFNTIQNDKEQILKLKESIIDALLNDIILLHHVGKEYSYSYLSYDEEFIIFFNDVLINTKADDTVIYNAILKKLVEITLINPENSLIDSMVSLNEDFGFCLEDIGECIKQREELKYVAKQEFISRNMFDDAFTDTIKTIDTSDLDW